MSIDLNSALSLSNVVSTKSRTETTLSDEQKSTIESVLSEFDSSKLSAEDARNIVSAFDDAGIIPGKDLANTLNSFGFDAHKIGDLADVGSNSLGGKQGIASKPIQGSQSAGVNQENLQILKSILDQYTDLEKLSNDDQTKLTDELFTEGLLEPGALIDTSR